MINLALEVHRLEGEVALVVLLADLDPRRSLAYSLLALRLLRLRCVDNPLLRNNLCSEKKGVLNVYDPPILKTGYPVETRIYGK